VSARRILLLALLTVAGLAGPATGPAGAEPVGTVSVLAHVPSPGFPADPRVVGNTVYEGTYTNPGGDNLPSLVFAYNATTGALERTYTVEGQDLTQPHGVQVGAVTARGDLLLLERTSGYIMTLDPRTGDQSLYATIPHLPRCADDGDRAPCKPTNQDQPPMPDYAAWGPDGSLYVTDYQQATIWRVPPHGGQAVPWFQSPLLDGGAYGTAGIVLLGDHRTLMFDQASQAGLGGANPLDGQLYTIPIEPDGRAGPLHQLWESPPTALPDGFAIARSGDIYLAEVGLTEQIVELSPQGQVIRTFGQAFTGANGSPVPFDSPSGLDWVGTRLVIANQSALAGDPDHQALLELETGEPGTSTFIPAGAGPRAAPALARHRAHRHRRRHRHARRRTPR
jgi:sugar lactone lactonase YvrE